MRTAAQWHEEADSRFPGLGYSKESLLGQILADMEELERQYSLAVGSFLKSTEVVYGMVTYLRDKGVIE